VSPTVDRRQSLWEAACALPVFDVEGSPPPLMALRRLHEDWRPGDQQNFSIYRTAEGVLALIALPQTHSFRVHYGAHDHPAAVALLALLREED
jgi:hypothetical protein